MKLNAFLLPIFAAVPLLMSGQTPTATIFSQDFNLLTDGTPEVPAQSESNPLAPELTDGQQWKGRGLHHAGGALAVMQFEQSDWFGTETVQGYVQTPYADVRLDEGSFTVSFRARSLDVESTTLKIEVYDPYTSNHIDATDLTITGEWQPFDIELSHPGYGNHLAYMQMAAVDGNWVIDDFEIRQTYTTVMPPMIHFAKNVTHEEFTGYWNPVPMAESYLVSAFCLDAGGEREYVVRDAATADCEYKVEGTVKGVQYYYTVRSVSALYASDEAEPRKVNVPLTELDRPVALEATDIRHDCFTARWEPTFRAMGYIVNLKRSHVATGDEVFTVLCEDFNKCKGYEGYPDWAAPFYENLDDYTAMPGWQAPNGPVTLDGMFGLDNSWKKYEEISLTSPSLDLSADGGRFSVALKIKGTPGQVLHATCGDAVASHTLVADYDEFTIDFTNGTDDTVIKFEFDDDSDSYNDNYLYFDEIAILQTVHAGETVTENVGSYDTGEPVTEHTFINLQANAGDIYTYTVTAWSYSLGEDGVWGPNVYSEASEPQQVVIPEESGVEDIDADAVAFVYVSDGMIVVKSACDEVMEVYNVGGMLLRRYNIVPGYNAFVAPAEGLLIAKLGSKVIKLTVR